MGRITDYPEETNPDNSDVLLLDGTKGTRTINYQTLKENILLDIPVNPGPNPNPEPEVELEQYGFKIDQNISTPFNMITYIEDNTNFQSAHMNYDSDTFDYGDWADAFFMKVKPCMLKYDGTVDYYLNPNDYSLKEDGTPSDIDNDSYEGNVMIEFPKTYWKIVDNGDDTANIYICNKKLDDKFHCWSHIDANGNEIPYCYMPAYNGFNDGTRLRSLSGKTPTTNIAPVTAKELALANNLSGVNWYTEVYSDRQFVNLLLLLIGKSTDSQTIFGAGNNNSSAGMKATGTLNTKGLFYGNQDNVSCVKVFGMENWYGNIWRFVDGWVYDDGTQKVKMTYGHSDGSTVDGYNFDGNGYIEIPNSVINGGQKNYITKMIFNENGMLPKTADKSGSAGAIEYYADGLWFSSVGIKCASFGASYKNGKTVGCFAATLYNSHSTSTNNFGSSISCKPIANTEEVLVNTDIEQQRADIDYLMLMSGLS